MARLPFGSISRPGGFRNIAEEEYIADNSALERRIHARHGVDVRCLEAGDNTVAVAAAVKGRSSCRRIHRHCRRRLALVAAANNTDFRFYLRSEFKPADRPSRRKVWNIAPPPEIHSLHCVVVVLHRGGLDLVDWDSVFRWESRRRNLHFGLWRVNVDSPHRGLEAPGVLDRLFGAGRAGRI